MYEGKLLYVMQTVRWSLLSHAHLSFFIQKFWHRLRIFIQRKSVKGRRDMSIYGWTGPDREDNRSGCRRWQLRTEGNGRGPWTGWDAGAPCVKRGPWKALIRKYCAPLPTNKRDERCWDMWYQDEREQDQESLVQWRLAFTPSVSCHWGRPERRGGQTPREWDRRPMGKAKPYGGLWPG